MKKIFILPILILPIAAHATTPVGPSAVAQGETPVVATANAPYETAGEQPGDTTNVVSASYVKGAYNDAIAAVNKVNANKQDKLVTEDGSDVQNDAIGNTFGNYMLSAILDGNGVDTSLSNFLITADGVAAGIINTLSVTGVKAVSTWGSDNNVTVLDFVPKNL